MASELSSLPTTMPNFSQDGSDQLHTDTPLIQLLSVSKTVLFQAVDLLDNYLTSDEQLTLSSKFLPGSTIGKHLRHARDHFVLLMDCASVTPPKTLSYDTRSRNTPMESSRTAAREALMETIRQLEAVVPTAQMNTPITLHAVTPHLQEFQTTFGRELWFAGLHCVHHWSMVRVIAGELNVQLTDDFGFAPSTLVYQNREAPLGKAKI
ncbi:hypothetical protein BDZ94DRAFT_1268226 [Collybia nuda]|uniref:DinB-like domain-containing protein n=1 Tax=Collybia nuda TaxID=64659 RepID=A0A9P6CBG3_9AGAR|nr:hypothetical protein BDZ94DRAFT_1268226 [Collybia nuda]